MFKIKTKQNCNTGLPYIEWKAVKSKKKVLSLFIYKLNKKKITFNVKIARKKARF